MCGEGAKCGLAFVRPWIQSSDLAGKEKSLDHLPTIISSLGTGS